MKTLLYYFLLLTIIFTLSCVEKTPVNNNSKATVASSNASDQDKWVEAWKEKNGAKNQLKPTNKVKTQNNKEARWAEAWKSKNGVNNEARKKKWQEAWAKNNRANLKSKDWKKAWDKNQEERWVKAWKQKNGIPND